MVLVNVALHLAPQGLDEIASEQVFKGLVFERVWDIGQGVVRDELARLRKQGVLGPLSLNEVLEKRHLLLVGPRVVQPEGA